MISSLSRAIAAFRVWLGLNDPAENRLHPSHGWLLSPAADRRVPAVALAPAHSPVSPALGKHS
jgi:hypothetical protein